MKIKRIVCLNKSRLSIRLSVVIHHVHYKCLKLQILKERYSYPYLIIYFQKGKVVIENYMGCVFKIWGS